MIPLLPAAFALIHLGPVARAQPAAPPDGDAADDTAADDRAHAAEDTARAAALEAALQRAADAESSAETADSREAVTRALLAAAGSLGDPRTPDDQRRDLAVRLGESGDPDALAALAAGLRSEAVSARLAAVEGLAQSPLPESTDLLSQMATDGWGASAGSARRDPEVREAAMRALGAQGRPAAGQALLAALDSPSVTGVVQRAGREALEAHYPELLEGRATPVGRTDGGTKAIVIVGGAAAGGVVLSSVGVWGQSDAAIGIGALGGAGVGGGLGGLWSTTRPLTRGQGLRFSSDAVWGITAGTLLGTVATNGGSTRAQQSGAAALRAVGATFGVVSGSRQALNRDVDARDVREQSLAGALGAGVGLSLARWSGRQEVTIRDEFSGSYTYWESAQPRAQAAGALAGAALGLGGAALVREPWQATGPDLGLAGLMAVQGAWITNWANEIGDQPYTDGVRLFGFSAGGLAGLGLGAAVDPTGREVATAAWGAGVGNSLGAGLPLLAGGTGDQALGAMLPTGVAGSIAGGLTANLLDMQSGDVALVGFAVPLAAIEGATIGAWSSNRGGLTNDQVAGLSLTLAGATGAVTTAIAPFAAPAAPDVGFVASATAWGAYHGAVVPLALDLPGDSTDLILISTLTADAFLVGGVALVSPLVDLDPRRTLVPQLGGLGGATLGSMTALLFSTDGTMAARGALVGSTLGFVTGGIIEAKRGPRSARASASTPRRRWAPDLPGDWAGVLMPAPTPDGGLGVQGELRVVGW